MQRSSCQNQPIHTLVLLNLLDQLPFEVLESVSFVYDDQPPSEAREKLGVLDDHLIGCYLREQG
jgi:hypothetical protein